MEAGQPYQCGYRNGRIDAFAGKRLDSFWFLANSADLAEHQFGEGYRKGWKEVQTKLGGK